MNTSRSGQSSVFIGVCEGAMVQVVIVGAGLAGLAAANTLSSATPGFQVTILEAGEEVGGRARTRRMGEHVVDLGATFMTYNSRDGDPVVEYALSKGLVKGMAKVRNYDDIVHTDKPRFHLLSNGEQLPSRQVEIYRQIYYCALDSMYDGIQCTSEDENSAFNVMIKRYFYSLLKSENILNELRSNTWTAQNILENLLAAEGLNNGSKISRNVDFLSIGDYIDEDHLCMLKDGYQSVALSLASNLPPTCSLLLNKQVQSIHWTPAMPKSGAQVTVYCQDGSSFLADHVIVTVSLGVLKSKCPQEFHYTQHPQDSFFIPSLPHEKQMAIHKLGYGAVSKIIMEFPEALSEEHGNLTLYWLKEDIGYPQTHPWATGQFVLDRKENTTVYYAWFVGEDAQIVDTISDEEVVEGICLVLKKFLQRSIAKPTKIARETWSTNPNFLGSYSFNTVGNRQDQRKALSQPVDGSTPLQLLFAGEATHPTQYATVNGAFDSGIREANRLLRFNFPHQFN